MVSSRFDGVRSRLSPALREHYRQEGYWADESLVDVAERSLDEYPDREFVGPNRRVTYDDIREEVRAVAAGLRERGVDPGDVVSYQLPNWVTAAVVHLAIAWVGAVANPITPIYREREVGYILRDSGSRCVIVPERYRSTDYAAMLDDIVDGEGALPDLEHVVVVGDAPDEVAGVPASPYDALAATDGGNTDPEPTISADDVHIILYTSGTTGDPKGVLHTHNTLLAESRQAARILGLSADSVVFMASPVGHVTGLCYGVELPFLEGMKAVYMDRWDPEQAVELIEREQCTVTMGATPFVRDLTRAAPENWESPLRVFSSGGAEVPPELVYEATEVLDCRVHRMYGLTELSTATWPSLDAETWVCAETDGPPAPGVEVKVVDERSREPVEPGVSGELLIRGPELMLGYADEAQTDAAFEGEWFRTGDLARLVDGAVEITGRLKDVIVRGGETISVKEVEDCIYAHPAVANVAVVAMPHPELGETGCAYVQLVEGASFTFEEMVDHVEEAGIAKQKTPERLEIVESFPETASGKIQKVSLREDIREKLGADDRE